MLSFWSLFPHTFLFCLIFFRLIPWRSFFRRTQGGRRRRRFTVEHGSWDSSLGIPFHSYFPLVLCKAERFRIWGLGFWVKLFKLKLKIQYFDYWTRLDSYFDYFQKIATSLNVGFSNPMAHWTFLELQLWLCDLYNWLYIILDCILHSIW